MGKFDHGPVRARDLTEQLKDKSRGRRARLVGVAAATSSHRPRRNDILPRLDLLYVPLEDLRAPPRTVRNWTQVISGRSPTPLAHLAFARLFLSGRTMSFWMELFGSRLRGS
jgi:hypothetical protein